MEIKIFLNTMTAIYYFMWLTSGFEAADSVVAMSFTPLLGLLLPMVIKGTE